MAFTKVAEATVAIPLPGSTKKRYIRIGSILENSNNDPSKGLPYMLMLDPWIDLPALHRAAEASGDSLPVSFYNIKQRDTGLPHHRERQPSGFDIPDDDIPF